MKRVRLALLALFVGLTATGCDSNRATGIPPCGNGPTMGSGC